MKRQTLITNISTLFARFVHEIKASNAISAFDLNRISEDILLPILAEIFSLHDLRNLNSSGPNYPGIDLGDEVAGVAFQITSNSSKKKLLDTLTTFVGKKQYERFPRLIIYDLTERGSYRSTTDFPAVIAGTFEFSVESDILDYRDLLRKINHLEIESISRIEGILTNEFSNREAGESAIGDLNGLSLIATRDADLITSFRASEEPVRLQDNLYVTRKVEAKLVDACVNDHVQLMLVHGEAGCGKTSVLWRLKTYLSDVEKTQLWFLRSTMLLPQIGQRDLTDTLFRAVRECRRRGILPILLLDTVDLLLHNESNRDFLVSILMKLGEAGCRVVATSRTQEMRKLSILEYRQFALLDYDSDEFPEAVRKHVSRFYDKSAQSQAIQQGDDILNSIARGLPIREVCLNPLTLRMLFTVYAPAEIPNDINIFHLYREFWTNRVEADNRGGVTYTQSRGENLQVAAGRIAVSMLSDGVPEIRRSHLGRTLENVDGDQVAMLQSRGVIRISEDDSLAFFHQTFFEHSAARGLLYALGEEAIELTRNRITSEPNDLFTLPIYEQILLLADSFSKKAGEAADLGLIALLESKAVSSIRSGLYVYCHRDRVTNEIDETLTKVICGSNDATQIRFLELAVNTSPGRLSPLFAQLDSLWELSSNRVKEHLLTLLTRLVPRHAELVINFFDRHEVFEYTSSLDGYSNAYRGLLSVIESVSFHNSQWSWKQIIRFLNEPAFVKRGRDSIADLISFLADNAGQFDFPEIATRFEQEAALLQSQMNNSRDIANLMASYGRLWNAQWRRCETTFDEITSDIDSTAGIRRVTRMNGLAEFLSQTASKPVAVSALEQYSFEDEPHLRSLWREVVFPKWISQGVPSPGFEVLLEFIKKSADVLASDPDNRIARDIILSFGYSEIDNATYRSIFKNPKFDIADYWLDAELLGTQLHIGILSRHPGAMLALDILKNDPSPIWSSLSIAAGVRIQERVDKDAFMEEAFLKIVTKAQDARLILRCLESEHARESPLLKEYVKAISDFGESLISERTYSLRRNGLMLIDRLLRIGEFPTYDVDQIVQLLATETDRRNTSLALAILGRSAHTGHVHFQPLFRVLKGHAEGSDEELRRTGLAALIRFVLNSEVKVGDYANDIVSVAIKEPINAERITLLRPLIDRIVSEDPDQAIDMLGGLILASDALGNSGKHKVYGRMKPLARRVVRFADLDRRRQFLQLASKVDRVLSCMVVDAICHESLADLGEELDELVLRKDFSGEATELIIRYRYSQERSSGGKAWADLRVLLASS